jgi:hypothetical protein
MLDLRPLGTEVRPDVPARAARWPDRVRCYRCRNFFAFFVVDNLFCSWECSGRNPEPEADPYPPGEPGPDVPRECRLMTKKRWKKRYKTRDDAQKYIDQNPKVIGLQPYKCGNCEFHHVGHSPYKAE